MKIAVFLLLKSVYISTRYVPLSVNVASRGIYRALHIGSRDRPLPARELALHTSTPILLLNKCFD